MPEPTDALRVQMLAWLAERPRSYREAMEAWRTSCPRLTIWEDAVDDDLIEVRGAGKLDDASVVVTGRGVALLQGQPSAA